MHRINLRKRLLAARDRLDAEQRRKKSRCIHTLLLAQPEVVAAEHLFVYVHFRSEVETAELIDQLLAAGETVSVPVTLVRESRLLAVQITDPATQLHPGSFGIPEPTGEQIGRATVDPATIDLVLVPGSVFDPAGGRLGYGGGFYDRFLTLDAPQAGRIGLAYTLQMVDQVPMEPHDQHMDMVMTEERIYECRKLREEK
ncbi:MAG: 5-formyltetrahydrofolate cyclo-ligase [Candidatus Electrothrix sp. YB6]